MQNTRKGCTRDQNIDSYDEMSFCGKIFCFNQNQKLTLAKFQTLASHGLMTIYNEWSKFQKDLTNILGDMTF